QGDRIGGGNGRGAVHPEGVGFAGAPDVHLHHARGTVGRRGEVRVVRAAPVLRLGDHGILPLAGARVVQLLEVPAFLIEAVVVPDVVQGIAGVEEVGDGRIDVIRGVLLLREGEVELEQATAVGAVADDVVVVP